MNKLEPKYKWLRPRNRFSDELVYREDGSPWSEIEALPEGWYIAFGEKMIDELNDLLVKYDFVDKYRITQIKEKYGGLRWYDNGFPEAGIKEYYAWLNKYELLSEKTCMVCGKKGKLRGGHWVMPLCDEHAKPIKRSKND